MKIRLGVHLSMILSVFAWTRTYKSSTCTERSEPAQYVDCESYIPTIQRIPVKASARGSADAPFLAIVLLVLILVVLARNDTDVATTLKKNSFNVGKVIHTVFP